MQERHQLLSMSLMLNAAVVMGNVIFNSLVFKSIWKVKKNW